jgi:hypothetical protein
MDSFGRALAELDDRVSADFAVGSYN